MVKKETADSTNANEYARVPNGYYDAKASPVTMEDGTVVYAQLGMSKNRDTKQVLVMFEIQSGQYKGAKLPWFGFLTKDAAKRTIESLRQAGWKGSSFADLAETHLESNVQVTVENEKYLGKLRSRVAWVGDGGGPNIVLEKTVDAKGAAGLDKEFAAFLGGK